MSMIKEKYIIGFQCVIDLEEKIQEKFSDRFREKVTMSSFRRVQGTIDGKAFWLSPALKKGYLVAICVSAENEEDKDVLDILKPVISEIMGDAEPICRYDLSTTFISNKKLDDESNNKSWMDEKFKKETIECMCPTIEWNIIEPESRIRSLSSKCGTEIENLQLLNGKNISDYVEKGQAYTLTRKPEKK